MMVFIWLDISMPMNCDFITIDNQKTFYKNPV